MNLMVKYIFLVVQVYSIVGSLVLQESSAFGSASGPEGNKRLEPSSSPNTTLNEPPPDAAAPIASIPDRSPPGPPVIPPTAPISVPPIPQPEKEPAITSPSPVYPPTASAQITSPPKNVLQSPPPVAQAAPPSISQAPPPVILPEPITPPPTRTPVASPPTSPVLPVPPAPVNLPLPVELPPSTLPSSPPSALPSPPLVPPTTLPGPPPMPPTTLPSPPPISPTTLSSPPPMPSTTLQSPPPVPPTTLSSPPPMPPTTLSSPPPMPPTTLQSPPPVPPTTLPSPPPVPPTTLPNPPPTPPSTLPSSPPMPASALPSSPPMPLTKLPRASPPSLPSLTMPPPNLPAPAALPPQASQVNVPPPHPVFAPPPSNLSVPVALPPSNSPPNLQPTHHNSSMPPPSLPDPHASPVSSPVLPSPPNRTSNDIAPSQPPPLKAPIVHKAPPPHSSFQSPPIKSHPPPSLPPVYPPPPPGPRVNPTHHNPPLPAGPESNHPRHHADAPTPPSLGSTVPPVENSISPSISPHTTSPSVPTTMPVFSPKVSPHYPPRIPKPLQALPPPPPNEDCSSMTCTEPLTSTPPGTPCKCVLPMQVELRLNVSLFIFFPLVSELAFEMASGLFMEPSQVRIMGANEYDPDPEQTLAMINLVPLGEKFDHYAASIIAQKLYSKQVPINYTIFVDYKALAVKYPGLPPSPPMPSSGNDENGRPYGHGNNGRDLKPYSADLSKLRHSNRLSGGVISIIALSAAVAVVLVGVAVWVLVVKRKDHAAKSGPTSATLPSLTKSSGVGGSMTASGPESASLSFRSTIAYNGTAKTFSSSEIEKATDNFNESGVLGEGGFGRVYSGVLEDGTKVAVKVLKRDDQQGGREFLAEVEMLSRLHHRNLVRLLGICTEEKNRCLVYELIPNGSVESHLHGIDKETAPLDWGARLKIALGAARGLAYLHEDSSPRVIHRDFKSSNILLEHDFTPKVSDFGLARSALDEENQHISTRVMGTFGYVAPEYAMTGHLLVKSDVYSYGVVLLELLTGRKPVDMSMPPGQENLVAWARPLLPTPEGLNLLIDPSLNPEVPFDSIAKVAAIASMCVQPEVSHRPFMGEVVQALKLVCNECEETRDLGSRSCSQEDLTSMDFDPRASTYSGPGLGPGPSRSTYQSYESPIDVESGFSGLGQDVESYRMGSSSGPLRPRRRLQIWERVKRFSSGSMNDYGELMRFLSRSR
ncbi:receptor-like serine/threonine-protein kinase ALE2 [Bidens hawaiensis]|uniref:receptor-like serine/threonine-protein kinase ALE2 n=1 Tax=Bidens hawaiensis TaxID=980011 RepID=UPI00404AC392